MPGQASGKRGFLRLENHVFLSIPVGRVAPVVLVSILGQSETRDVIWTPLPHSS